MKFAIVFAALFTLSFAALASYRDGQIIRLQKDIGSDDFSFDFEISDGSSQQAQGQLKQVDSEHAALVQSGSYRYKGDNGETYQVEWTADELGYHPKTATLVSLG